jgi:GT2 family glycosyltransferase
VTIEDHKQKPSVDVVIPIYKERPEALSSTLTACLKQTHPISRIYVVDDGSPEPVNLPEWALSLPQISLLRLRENLGISAARNAAIAVSKAEFIACVNTEVLPDPDWLDTCASALSSHPKVGACYTRLVAIRPKRLLTQWRMRFLETKFGEQSGLTPFAPGHAVLFRKEALLAVGGYDPSYRLHHEDSDICFRMRKAGWETFYAAQSRCISIQADSLGQVASKELRERGWYPLVPRSPISLFPLLFQLSRFTFIRAGRNIVRGYFQLLPVDAAIWATAMWIAAGRTLRGIK